MIPQSSFIGIYLMIAIGVILPLGVAIWWLRKSHDKIKTVLIGAATWFIFAIILEAIPKLLLLDPAKPIGRTILGNAALATLVAAMIAGIFEETGRLVAFKFVLKKEKNKETSISHGIGHGGFEALYLLGISGVQYLSYASMINAGKFQELIDAASAQGADVSSLNALPQVLQSINALTSCFAGVERIFAMLLHVGLSILVFYAVKRSKGGLYFLAVLLHALFDVPAALYQFGIIKNVFVVETILAVYAVGFFIVVYKKLYSIDLDL